MTVPFDLDGAGDNVRSSSTNMGRLVCAALTEGTGAEVALINGGSIRGSIKRGAVTKGQFLSVFPFGNYAILVDITGKDLLAALNHGLGAPGSGAFPQFWGLTVELGRSRVSQDDPAKAALTPDSVTIGGKRLDLEAKYALAVTDFMHSGGDGYSMLAKYPYREVATMEEIFRDFMAGADISALEAISDASVLR
jgi:2',3'-cyclic-nucleotide 2'-phosphodiesterase (5'-nucleotidase family)